MKKTHRVYAITYKYRESNVLYILVSIPSINFWKQNQIKCIYLIFKCDIYELWKKY